MKGTEATFLKRPRTHKGMTLGAITRYDMTCKGETTTREKKRMNPRNRKTNDGSLARFIVGRSGESRKSIRTRKGREKTVPLIPAFDKTRPEGFILESNVK